MNKSTEIAALAIAAATPIHDVLKLALQAARNAGDRIATEWLNEEMNGYALPERVPGYRRVVGEVGYFDSRGAWVKSSWWGLHSERDYGHPAVSLAADRLEAIVAGHQTPRPEDADTLLTFPVPKEVALSSAATEFFVAVRPPALAPILQAVRSRVYEWVIALEQAPDESIDRAHLFDVREFHLAVVTHSRGFFAAHNYFHAVFEAAKAYDRAVKEKARSKKFGSDLMLSVWGEKGSLKVKERAGASNESVQDGVKFLSAGLMEAIRNPGAHDAADSWAMTQQECLEILSLISFLFRKLDDAEKRDNVSKRDEVEKPGA